MTHSLRPTCFQLPTWPHTLRARLVGHTQNVLVSVLAVALVISLVAERVTFKVMVDKLENYRCSVHAVSRPVMLGW